MVGLESTRLFRALAPSRSWLKGVRRNLMCNAAGLAPLALMCGVYWPCPETRAGDFGPRLTDSLGHPLNSSSGPRVIVKGRLGGSELSLPVSGLLGLVCEGISLTT